MENVKRNFFSRTLWLRILYMIVFYIVSKVVMMLIVLIAAVQTVASLLTGAVIEPIWAFSNSLNQYMLQILDFLSFRVEEKPFPFSEWPENSKTYTVNKEQDENH